MWRSIILIFFLPISAFASFPVEINLCQDTIVENKKEIMESKQVHSSSSDVVPNKNFLRIFSGVLVALGLVLLSAAENSSNFESTVFLFLCSILFVGLGVILFLIDLIRRAVLSRSS